MPTPDAKEGPPPTSVPPNTPPPGFVLGTGGATSSDAAQGLLMHSVTFDDTGRLVQEEWADPVSGRAVTNVYNADRKLAVSFVSVLTGHTIRVTTITYSAHTWTTGTGPIPRGSLAGPRARQPLAARPASCAHGERARAGARDRHDPARRYDGHRVLGPPICRRGRQLLGRPVDVPAADGRCGRRHDAHAVGELQAHALDRPAAHLRRLTDPRFIRVPSW